VGQNEERSEEATMNAELEWQEVERRGVSLIDKGITERELGLHEEALTTFNKAIDVSRSVSHESDPVARILAHALDNKARSLMDLGRPAEAIPCFDEAISVQEGVVGGDRTWRAIREIAVSVMNKGAALAQLSRDEDALDCFECALDGFRQCESAEDAARALINCGNLYFRRLRFDEALAMLDESQAILGAETAYEPEASKVVYAYALASKAHLLLALERYHEACDLCDRSLGILRAVVSYANGPGEREDLGDTLELHGQILTALGRVKEAAECFREAEELEKKREPAWARN